LENGMSESLRGAVIGCGHVARHHLAAWARVPGARLVALCEHHPTRLAAARAAAPDLAAYPDAAVLLASEPLDFVEICTGPEVHRALTEQAAARGLHVLCQKPAACSREDLVAMIAACDRAGVQLAIHENWRTRPWYRAMRQALDAGAIGRPLRLRLAHHDTRALRPGGFAEQPFLAARQSLILLEMGPHAIDVARYLMGEVATVQAATARAAGHPGEDTAMLVLRFATGALGLVDLCWAAPAETARPEWALNATTVEGTAGAIRLRADGSLLRVDLDGRAERLPVALPDSDAEVYLQAYVAVQRGFIEAIRSGRPHETDGRDTLCTMDVLWAAYRAAAEGRTVPIDAVSS
jgi:predicted dehydrogenase